MHFVSVFIHKINNNLEPYLWRNLDFSYCICHLKVYSHALPD